MARTYEYVQDLAATSTTETTYQNKASLSFGPDGSSSYLLIWSLLVNGSLANPPDVRLYDATASTALTSDPITLSPNGSGSLYNACYGIAIATFGASPTSPQEYKLQFKSSSGGTLFASTASILAIKLSGDDESATNNSESTNAADTDYHDQTTLTFTPATTGDYLIIATAEQSNGTNGRLTKVQLYDGTNAIGEAAFDDSNADRWRPWGTCAKVSLTGSVEVSYKIQFGRGEGAGTAKIKNARIVALRLDGFDNSYYAEARTRTTTKSLTLVDKVTLTETPAARVHYILSCGSLDTPGTVEVFGAVDEDGTAIADMKYDIGVGHQAPWMIGYSKTLTAESHTWKTQWCGTNEFVNFGHRESAIAVLDLGSDTPTGGVSKARGVMIIL